MRKVSRCGVRRGKRDLRAKPAVRRDVEPERLGFSVKVLLQIGTLEDGVPTR